MNQNQIIALQQRVGATPDGFWGPVSISKCKSHLRSLMPQSNPWPSSDKASLTEFYGKPGDESKLVSLVVSDFGVQYDGKDVRTIRCHHKIAPSLYRIIEKLSKTPHAWVLKEYAGCYNNRLMRDGSLPSLHARGAAVDLAASTNGNREAWPSSANMPIEVMEEFAKEGATPAGAFWGRDAMHMEFTKPR